MADSSPIHPFRAGPLLALLVLLAWFHLPGAHTAQHPLGDPAGHLVPAGFDEPLGTLADEPVRSFARGRGPLTRLAEGGEDARPGSRNLSGPLLLLAAAAAVFELLRRLGFGAPACFLGALFFGIHPLQIEAAYWPAAQAPLRGAVFGLWALVAWASTPRPAGAVLTTFFGILALLAWPPAAGLGAVLWLLPRAGGKRSAAVPLVLLVLGVGACTLAWLQTPGTDGLAERLLRLPAGLAAETAALVRFTSHSYFHAPPTSGIGLARMPVLVGLGLLVSFAIAASSHPRARLGLALWLAGLLPALLLPHSSLFAEHWVVLALGGVAVVFAEGAERVGKRRGPGRVVFAGLLILSPFAVSSRQIGATWADTEAVLAMALESDPENVRVLDEFGRFEARRGRLSRAAELYEQALALDPDAVAPRVHLARIEILRGLFPGRRIHLNVARKHLEEALALDPDDGPANGAMAEILQRNGDPTGALEHFERALSERPGDYTLHRGRGMVCLDLRRPEEATVSFENAVDLAPDRPDAWCGLALAARQRADVTLAEAHLRKTLELEPDYHEAHSNLGQLLLELGRAPEALAHLETAVDLNPDSTEALFLLAGQEAARGQKDKALRRVTRLLSVQPGHVRGSVLLARLELDGGRLSEALAPLNRVLGRNPGHADANALLGELALRAGNDRLALEHLTRALEAEPGRHGDRARQALALVGVGELERAREVLDKLLASRPSLGPAHHAEARLQSARGEIEPALASLERALQLDGNQGLAWALLAALREGRGEWPAAVDAARKAQDLLGDWPRAERLARLLAAAPPKELRDGPRALELARSAVERTERRQPRALQALAAALAESGDFASATSAEAEAAALLEGEARRASDARRASYAARRPLRLGE